MAGYCLRKKAVFEAFSGVSEIFKASGNKQGGCEEKIERNTQL